MSVKIRTLYIMFCSVICFILIVIIIEYYKFIMKERNKIRPIIQITSEELKDEFDIRMPQITGEENIWL